MIFSIVIPTRNRPKLLLEAITSVVQQTTPSWEVIIIDDASEQAVATLPDKLLQDERLLLFTNQQQMGVGYCRNLGMEKAQGEWILFLDDDDVLEPRFLEAASTSFSELDPQALMMPCGMHPSSNRASWAYHQMKVRVAHNLRIPMRRRDNFHLLIDAPPQMPSLICKREILKTVRFDENIHYGEDLLVWAELMMLGVPIVGALRQDLGRALIRQHDRSQLSAAGGDDEVLAYFRLLDKRLGPIDSKSTASMRVKKVMRAARRRHLREVSKEFSLGMKKPRYFLGPFLYQLRLKFQIVLSYYVYRLLGIDL